MQKFSLIANRNVERDESYYYNRKVTTIMLHSLKIKLKCSLHQQKRTKI